MIGYNGMVLMMSTLFVAIKVPLVFGTCQDSLPQNDDCRSQLYKISIANKTLTGHVIENKTVISEENCRIQCYFEPRCVSTNFNPQARDSPNCELSSSDAEIHPEDLKDKPGVIYTGTENYCKNATCPAQHMVCHSGYGLSKYRCVPQQYCQEVPKKHVLFFPKKSTTDYLLLLTSFPSSLTSFTISLMAKLDSVKGVSTLFSLASKSIFNNVIIWIQDGRLALCVSNQWRRLQIQLVDSKWHLITTMWENTKGTWQVYVDGCLLEQGTGLSQGLVIENGAVVLGQEQDSYMGRFQKQQSIGQGSLTSVGLWDRVFQPHNVSFLSFTNFACHPAEGNILKWNDLLKGQIKGDLKVL